MEGNREPVMSVSRLVSTERSAARIGQSYKERSTVFCSSFAAPINEKGAANFGIKKFEAVGVRVEHFHNIEPFVSGDKRRPLKLNR